MMNAILVDLLNFLNCQGVILLNTIYSDIYSNIWMTLELGRNARLVTVILLTMPVKWRDQRASEPICE